MTVSRRLFLALCFFCVVCASASGAVQFKNSVGTYQTGSTTCGGSSVNITPTAGDDLIFVVRTFNGPTFSSVSQSQSLSILTNIGFSAGFGVWQVHGATAVSQYFSVIFTSNAQCMVWLIDATPGSFDQQAVIATGTGTAFLTNAITPVQNGAMLLTLGWNSGAATYSGWNTGTATFTVLSQHVSTSPTAYMAYLDQTTSASTTAGTTISTSESWTGYLWDYIPYAPFVAAPVYSNGKPLLSQGHIVN